MKKSAYFAVLCIVCSTWGCQALVKDEALIEQVAQDIVTEEIQEAIPKK